MAVDTAAKRMAVGHVKRPMKGVYPGSTSTVIGRSAIGWSYVPFDAPPPSGGVGSPAFGLGQKKSFSDAAELGGGSW